MSLEALVFDFDGLILDTEWPEFATVREEFEAHGLELALEDWQEIVGRADHRHWFDWLEDELGRELERSAVIERRRARHHLLIAAQEVRPGVLGLLDEAEAAAIPIAVASSSPESWVRGHLERLGLLERFHTVRCREHVERAKPAPDLFLAAVRAMGASPSRSVALEDSRHGCTAATEAGLVCVVAPNDVTRSQVFDHAHLVVGSLVEVSLSSLTTLVDQRLG
jgi:HAD superfamily hydrolase (TIGR01509 family)